jgi:hypothetical protein
MITRTPSESSAVETTMMKRGLNFTRFLIEQKKRSHGIDDALISLINDVSRACKNIAILISKGAVGDYLGDANAVNVQGEQNAGTIAPARAGDIGIEERGRARGKLSRGAGNGRL